VKLPKFLRLGSILCCIFLLFTGCGEGEQKEQEQNNTVQVRIGNLVGNGVIWDMTEDECVIATAGHILAMGEGEIEVVFPDGFRAGVSDYWATDIDLAFLVVDCSTSEGWQGKYCPVEVNQEKSGELRVDEIVWIKGFAGSREEMYEALVRNPWIYVEDFGQYMVMLQTKVEPGLSGAGIFTEENVFLGIICGGNEDGEAVATPVSVVSAWYENLKE